MLGFFSALSLHRSCSRCHDGCEFSCATALSRVEICLSCKSPSPLPLFQPLFQEMPEYWGMSRDAGNFIHFIVHFIITQSCPLFIYVSSWDGIWSQEKAAVCLVLLSSRHLSWFLYWVVNKYREMSAFCKLIYLKVKLEGNFKELQMFERRREMFILEQTQMGTQCIASLQHKQEHPTADQTLTYCKWAQPAFPMEYSTALSSCLQVWKDSTDNELVSRCSTKCPLSVSLNSS